MVAQPRSVPLPSQAREISDFCLGFFTELRLIDDLFELCSAQSD